MIGDWGQAGDPKGWQRTLGDRQETPGQTRGAGDRQVMLWAGRHPRDKAGDLRHRQGPQLRSSLTSALGDLQQAGAGDGDATLLLRGDSGGLPGRPMGGGPCRALRDHCLLAKLCHISTFREGSSSWGPPALKGCPAKGAGDSRTPGEERGDGQSFPRPSCRKLAARTPRPTPPSPRSPFVSARQSAACAGAGQGRIVLGLSPGRAAATRQSWHMATAMAHRSWHTVVVQPVVVAHSGGTAVSRG